MDIYIAKHFWKDGENSTWECHEKIDKELFKYLKNNYPFFSKEKPKKIQEGKHFVYLCYKDDIDNYGRNIVNITFFIVKRERSMDFCSKKNIKNLQIKLLDFKMIISSILGLILVGIGIYFTVDRLEKEVEKVSIVTIIHQDKRDYSQFISAWNKQLKGKNKFKLLIDENLTFINQLNDFTDTDVFTQELTEDEIIQKLKEITKKNNMSDIVEFILITFEKLVS